MNRVVVISGASRGIGLAAASRFAAEGDVVFSLSRTSPMGHSIQHLACDVTRPEQVRDAVRQVAAAHNRIDVLVANSGLAGSDSVSPDDDGQMWDGILKTNLYGAYYLLKFARPYLPQGGTVITIGSVLSLMGVPDQPAYCAAKHAVLGFTRAMAKQLAGAGITVNCICPGWVDTEMAQGRMNELRTCKEELALSIPTGRLTTPDEVANLCLFLASPAARNMTGQALTIDGGSL